MAAIAWLSQREGRFTVVTAVSIIMLAIFSFLFQLHSYFPCGDINRLKISWCKLSPVTLITIQSRKLKKSRFFLHFSHYWKLNITVESRDYAPPPFVHARIGQKWGGGLYAGSSHFRVTTITDRRMPRGRAISVLSISLAVWWAKLEKNDKVRHNMTQIASLLAVATVFIDLWTPFYSQGGGLIRETKLPMQELEL